MDITIPGRIVRFLEQYANIAFAGTRDRALVPHGHQLSGWRIGADARTLTVFISEQFTAHLMESLEDNGELAITIEEFPSHETYQFKGHYLQCRPLARDDIEAVDRIRDRFVRNVRPLYADVPEHLLRAFILKPCLAVELQVAEVYLQTPGPGAGSRLVPPEGA